MFKNGNIVRKTNTYWYGRLNESKEDIGKLYVIEYNYGEKYGNGIAGGGYSILDMETGCSSAWWHDDQLEFIEEGGINLIRELQEKSNNREKLFNDLDWIKENYPPKSGTSWLKLMSEIGYNSTFNSNGEFYVLYSDIQAFKPLFDAIFNGNKELALDMLSRIFKEEYIDKYKTNVSMFYDKVNIK